MPRNPKWSREELILALDLYFQQNPSHISKNHPDVIELSRVLNQLLIHRQRPDSEAFRNPNGVYMKLCNYLRLDPEYEGVGLRRGGKLEETIWNEFARDLGKLRATANAIKLGVHVGQETPKRAILRVITDQEMIRAAWDAIRTEVERRATLRLDADIGFHGGKESATVFWLSNHNLWIGLNTVENRYWNAVGFGNPSKSSSLTIVVEINTPFEGIDRRIGGVMAADSEGHLYLLHRGKVGGGRPGIGKRAFLEWYPEELTTVQDGAKSVECIMIGELQDPLLSARIAGFAKAVQRFKSDPAPERSGPRTELRYRSAAFSPEYSGRHAYTVRDQIWAQARHGTVVNELSLQLEGQGLEPTNDRYRDLVLPTRDNVPAHLFEVKTKADSQSVYTAVGQLLCHNVETAGRMVAVLPSGVEGWVADVLAQLEIDLVTYAWKGDKPIFFGLEDLDLRASA